MTFAALRIGKSEIIKSMLALGLGVFTFVLVIVSGWITNSVNLNGCSLSVAAIFPKFHEWQIALVSGIVGTVIAFF